MNNIIVTGGAGFIGSALVRHIIRNSSDRVCVIDKLTYAGNMANISEVIDDERLIFEKTDICDRKAAREIFRQFQPTHVLHLAAESHVDRSIDSPAAFIESNINGTYSMLECSLEYLRCMAPGIADGFRFVHVSTDEVFGDLGSEEERFNENSPYRPNSPYSASKAAADHLVRAWGQTFGLNVIICNSSNNYGPYQFPEKFIPLTILSALSDREIPVYGDGRQIRDWMYVNDNAAALYMLAMQGIAGESYNIGSGNEITNIELAVKICGILDRLVPRMDGKSYTEQITHVSDRPGHDRRYAVDPSKLEKELNWHCNVSFDEGLETTVKWYIEHRDSYCADIMNGTYRLERLGKRQ